MNVAESNAVHVLLDWLLQPDDARPMPSNERARDAAALLADRAHTCLMTGAAGERVRELWVQLEVPSIASPGGGG